MSVSKKHREVCDSFYSVHLKGYYISQSDVSCRLTMHGGGVAPINGESIHLRLLSQS